MDRRADHTGRSKYDIAEVTLTCDVDHKRAWKCEAEVEMVAVRSGGSKCPFGIEVPLLAFCLHLTLQNSRVRNFLLFSHRFTFR